MMIRAEVSGDEQAIRSVHVAAFGSPESPGAVTVEADLVDELRTSEAWIPTLSLVAMVDDHLVGHVVCTRARVGRTPVLALGPIGVEPSHQNNGVGTLLMHAVIAEADLMSEPLIGLVGAFGYYARFDFVAGSSLGIIAPVPEWGDHFQIKPLAAYRDEIRGLFEYPKPFNEL